MALGGLFFGILLAPLGAIVGTIYGAFAVNDPVRVEEAVKVLEGAGQKASLQYEFRDGVIDVLRQAHVDDVKAAGEDGTTEPAANTVVEVWITDITLAGSEAIEPVLTLQLSGGMRVLREGVELQSQPVRMEGVERHTFWDWAADDAKLFEEQIASESKKLAAEIVIALLARPAPRPPEEKIEGR